MVKISMAGTFENVIILNSPAQAVSVGNKDTLVISGVTVDNKAGSSKGHNTDCFDVSSSSLTIKDSFCYNQDDCIAINSGSDIYFQNNLCSGGHGMSIGSIKTGKVVSNVHFVSNTVEDSAQAYRIKTYSDATSASVSDIYYDGNTATGITDYGLLIVQDYTNSGETGTASNDVPIDGVYFTGTDSTAVVQSDGFDYKILCGTDTCTNFDLSGFVVSGGKAGTVTGATGITFGSITSQGASTKRRQGRLSSSARRQLQEVEARQVKVVRKRIAKGTVATLGRKTHKGGA